MRANPASLGWALLWKGSKEPVEDRLFDTSSAAQAARRGYPPQYVKDILIRRAVADV